MRLKRKLLAFVRKNRLAIIIITAAVAGLLLVFGSSGKKAETITEKQSDTAQIQELESRIESLLSNVEGVGRCEVIIYTASGNEYVYAQKTTTGTSGESKNYEVINATDGEAPILIKKISPQIAGVAVVCSGGGSTAVKNAVREILGTLLNIPVSSISVNKKK